MSDSNTIEKQVPKKSLFVVGDDAQSIYGFRGSKIEIILNFEKEYDNVKEITLNQNYRSTQPILDLAEKILTHNKHQKKKGLFTDNNDQTTVSYYLARNEKDEAEYIVRKLASQYLPDENNASTTTDDRSIEPENYFDEETISLDSPQGASNETVDPVSSMFDIYMAGDEFKPSQHLTSSYDPSSWDVLEYNWDKAIELDNCAILYRTHGQSRSIEEALMKYKVPYKLVSGVRFLDRKEIKDVLAILKFVANGEDKISLNRFLPLVMKGVGPKTMEKILLYLEDFEYPLPSKHAGVIMNLLEQMQKSWLNNTKLVDFTKDILQVVGYLSYLKSYYPEKEEYNTRIENISELYSLMLKFDDEEKLSLTDKLTEFLGQVSLMTNQDDNEDKDVPKISLMSLHQSKGLEFESVFLVGVEDNLLPHSNSYQDPNGIDEEVRLAYVGVTRAKKYLHLIGADSRILFGQIQSNPVSRIFRQFITSHCEQVYE